MNTGNVNDSQVPFSYVGAGLALVGNLVALPADWSATLRALLAWAGAMAVGVGGPMLQRAIKDWMEVKSGLRRAERRNEKLEAELAALRAGAPIIVAAAPLPADSDMDAPKLPAALSHADEVLLGKHLPKPPAGA